LYDFSVRDKRHTEKIYTHRKIEIILSVFIKLTRKKLYTHGKNTIILLVLYYTYIKITYAQKK